MSHSNPDAPAIFVLCRNLEQNRDITAMLQNLPWPVREFDSASELASELGTGCVLVVDNDGLDLLLLIDRLRRRRDTVRTILVTSEPSVAQATAALRAGFDDLMEVPIREHQLRQRVLANMVRININDSL